MRIDIEKADDLEEIGMKVNMAARLDSGGIVQQHWNTNEVILLKIGDQPRLLIDLTAEFCEVCGSGIKEDISGRVLHFSEDCPRDTP